LILRFIQANIIESFLIKLLINYYTIDRVTLAGTVPVVKNLTQSLKWWVVSLEKKWWEKQPMSLGKNCSIYSEKG